VTSTSSFDSNQSIFDQDYQEEFEFFSQDDLYIKDRELFGEWISETEANDAHVPTPEKWKDMLNEDFPCEIVMDKTKAFQWSHQKKEIEYIKSRIRMKVGLDCEEEEEEEQASRLTEKDVFELVFGRSSVLATFFEQEIGVSLLNYLKFLQVYALQSAYSVSSSQLFAQDSLLNPPRNTTAREYNDIWKEMANKNKLNGTQISSVRRMDPLWYKLESRLNEWLRSITFEGRQGDISVSIDDDKVHFELANERKADTFNLKFQKHVRANRNGITAHTCVSSAGLVPMAIAFERKNDTTATCYKRMMDTLTRNNEDCSRAGALRNIIPNSDRAYNGLNFVFDYLIANGARPEGTTIRSLNQWPFTYDQKPSASDKRTYIDSAGAPTLFLKVYENNLNQKIYATAFRNGTGGVVTSISSMHGKHSWEGKVEKPNDLLMYKEDSKSLIPKFFQRQNDVLPSQERIEEENDMLQELLSTTIRAITLTQSSADWHYMRKFSLTSSQSHAAFLISFPKFGDSNHWRMVASFFDEQSLIGSLSSESDDDETQEDEEQELLDQASYQAYFENITDQPSVDIIRDILNNDTVFASTDEANSFYMNMENDLRKEVQILLTSHVRNESHRLTFKKKEVLTWLQKNNENRMYLAFNSEGLKHLLRERGLNLPGRFSYDRAISLLVEDASSSTTTTARVNLNHVEHAAMRCILERSFLKHQKGEEREYCKQGHKLEAPIMKQWINETMDSSSDIDVQGATCLGCYTTGLAARKNAIHARDSIDFILSVEMEDESIVPWGVEIKSRLTLPTANTEINLAYETGKHNRINMNEALRYIPKADERWQVAQHAYVYDLDTVVLIIGDAQGQLIRSVIVDFTLAFRDAFGRVLFDIRSMTLDWFYFPLEEALEGRVDGRKIKPFVVKIPEDVHRVAETLPSIGGRESFQGTANLCMSLNILDLPFPTFNRLIPTVCSHWNLTKGGSDVTTKMMDDKLVKIPKAHINMETVAVNRFIGLVCVVMTRLCQIVTNRSEKRSLLHYRNAANQRWSMHKVCVSIYRHAETMIERLCTPNPRQIVMITPPHNARRQPRRQKINGIIPEDITFLPAQSSCPTPHRLQQKLKQGNLPQDLSDTITECTGYPMQYLPSNTRSKCALCQKNTKWRCMKCKRFLCLSRSIPTNCTDLTTILAPPFGVLRADVTKERKGKEEYHFQWVCFHIAHEKAWKASNINNANED
jgi:hypothetical protein